MSRSYYRCGRLPEAKSRKCKRGRRSGYGEFILRSLGDCACMYITKQSDSSWIWNGFVYLDTQRNPNFGEASHVVQMQLNSFPPPPTTAQRNPNPSPTSKLKLP